jgi:hypothetical protein
MSYRVAVVASALAAGIVVSAAQAQNPPAFGGNYRCEPQPAPCQNGQTFTVSQSGNNLDIKNDKGDQGTARITSDKTLSVGAPWNMVGVVYDSEIQWSNGTKWRKQ